MAQPGLLQKFTWIPPASGGIRSAFLAEDFSATAHTPYLIAAIGIVGSYGKQINTFRQRLEDQLVLFVRQIGVGVAKGVQVRAAAQGLARLGAVFLAGVVDQRDGHVEGALQLPEKAE